MNLPASNFATTDDTLTAINRFPKHIDNRIAYTIRTVEKWDGAIHEDISNLKIDARPNQRDLVHVLV